MRSTASILMVLLAPLAAPALEPPIPPGAERVLTFDSRQRFPAVGNALFLDDMAWGGTGTTGHGVRVAVGRDGVTHVLWTRFLGRVNATAGDPPHAYSIYTLELCYVNDAPGTRTVTGFSEPFVVDRPEVWSGDGAGTPHLGLDVDPAGRVHVLWRRSTGVVENGTRFLSDHFYRRRDPVLGWQSRVQLTRSSLTVVGSRHTIVDYLPNADLAVDADGTAYIAYIERVDRSDDTGEVNLYCHTRSAAGTSTEAVARTVPVTGQHSDVVSIDYWSPVRVAANRRGFPAGLTVLWTLHHLNDPDPQTTYNMVLVASRRGPGGWSHEPVSDPHSTCQSAGRDLFVDTGGVAHCCFVQWTTGVGNRLFYGRVGGVPEVVDVHGVEPPGGDCRLVVDSRGQPHIVGCGNGPRHVARIDGRWRVGPGGEIARTPAGAGELAISDLDEMTLATADASAIGSPSMPRLNHAVVLLQRLSRAELGPPDGWGAVAAGPGAAANLVNGNLFFTLPLFAAADGAGFPAALTLVYNSLAPDPSPLGRGWQHEYDVVLTDGNPRDYGFLGVEGPDRVISIRFGDGRVVEFADPEKDGLYLAFPRFGCYAAVERGALGVALPSRNNPAVAGRYLLTAKDGTEYVFDDHGRLLALVDLSGNVLALDHGPLPGVRRTPEGTDPALLRSVTDSEGRKVLFEYDPDGRLVRATDPKSRAYSFKHEGEPARLTRVSFDATASDDPPRAADAWGFDWHGWHDAPEGRRAGLLAVVRAPRGQAADPPFGTAYFYYPDNRFARVVDPPAAHVLDSALDPPFERTVFPAFLSVEYENGEPAGQDLSEGREAWTAAVTGRRGNAPGADPLAFRGVVAYQHARAVATRVQDPLGRCALRTFADFDPKSPALFNRNVLSVRDRRGCVTDFTYATGTAHVRDLVETVTSPAVAGDPRRPVTRFAYDRFQEGRDLFALFSVKDPREKTTAFAYFPDGGLRQVTHPADADTPPSSESFTYDSRGRIATHLLTNGRTVSWERARLDGDVWMETSVSLPGLTGSPGRIATDCLGVVVRHALPGRSDATELVPDARDRIVEVVAPAVDGARARARRDYDADSGLVCARTPLQLRDGIPGTSFAYDDAGRCVRVTGPLGASAAVKHDADGNPRESTAFGGGVAVRAYDALGRLAVERLVNSAGPDCVTRCDYDPDGRLERVTRAGGAGAPLVTDLVYDARGNCARVVDPETPEGRPVTVQCYDLADHPVLFMRRIVQGGDPRSDPGRFVSGTAVAVDAFGRPVRVIDLAADPGACAGDATVAAGTRCDVRYDPGGTTEVTVAAGTGVAATVTAREDAAGRPVEMVGPDTPAGRAVVNAAWTDDGLPETVVVDCPSGAGTADAATVHYNARRERVRVVDALGLAVDEERDLDGRLVLRTDPDGYKTGFLYDPLGRLVETRAARARGVDPREAGDAAVFRARYEHDDDGNTTAVEVHDRVAGLVRRFDLGYDGLGRRVSLLHPPRADGTRPAESWAYDEAGRVLSHTDPAGRTAVFTRDGLGRVRRREHRAAAGALLACIDVAYDDAGLPASVTDGARTVRCAYTTAADAPQPAGLLKSAAWSLAGAGGPVLFQSVACAYDERGRRRAMTGPDGAVVRYAWHADGRIWKITRQAPGDAERLFAEYSYRKGGELERVALGNGTVKTFACDAAGRLLRMDLVAASGRLLSSVSFGCDGRGNREWVERGPAGARVAYAYDALSRLVGEECPGSGGGGGAPPFENRFADVSAGNESGPSAVVEVVPPAVAGVPFWRCAYELDDAGNRTARRAYDLSGALVESSDFAYDGASRLVSERFVSAGGTPGAYLYGHDACGNMTRRVGADADLRPLDGEPVLAWGYDHDDRLVSFARFPSNAPGAAPAASWSYAYMPGGERVFRTDLLAPGGGTEAFMCDGPDVVADYQMDASGPVRTRSYLQGLGVDSKLAIVEPSNEAAGLFFDTDALGSVLQVVGTPAAPGADPETWTGGLRTAWGERVGGPRVGGLFEADSPASPTRYGFTQREHDPESGLVYFRARHYWPRLGRFLQRDPLEIDKLGLSPYAYALGNPLTYTDPFGEDEFERNRLSQWLAFLGNLYVGGDISLDANTPAAMGTLGFVAGLGTGGQNVVTAGKEAAIGTVQAVVHPLDTYDAAVDNIALTINAIDSRGLAGTLSDAGAGAVEDAKRDPSLFFARLGVGAGTAAIPLKVPPALASALKNSRYGQLIVKISKYEVIKSTPSGSGGFGVLGRVTEGAYPLDEATRAVVRKEILSVAKSNVFLKSVDLLGAANMEARKMFWDLLRYTEVTGSTRGGAAGILKYAGDEIGQLRIAIKAKGSYLLIPRQVMIRHELDHFVREAKLLVNKGVSLFGREARLSVYDPRKYVLMMTEEPVAWWLTLFR